MLHFLLQNQKLVGVVAPKAYITPISIKHHQHWLASFSWLLRCWHKRLLQPLNQKRRCKSAGDGGSFAPNGGFNSLRFRKKCSRSSSFLLPTTFRTSPAICQGFLRFKPPTEASYASGRVNNGSQTWRNSSAKKVAKYRASATPCPRNKQWESVGFYSQMLGKWRKWLTRIYDFVRGDWWLMVVMVHKKTDDDDDDDDSSWSWWVSL